MRKLEELLCRCDVKAIGHTDFEVPVGGPGDKSAQ